MTDAHRQLQAVLWDFDGTLADSEQFWIAAEFELAAELGGSWTHEDSLALVGRELLSSGNYFRQRLGRPDLSPEWIVEQLVSRVACAVRTGPIPWRPGALELLAELNAAGVPCALVSASYQVILEAAVAALPQGEFAAVVSGDAVSHGKPHPEPYLRGAAELGADPRNCVVIEDSVPGADSGNAAGALVLGVRNLVDIPPAPRRVLRSTLSGIKLSGLRALVSHDCATSGTDLAIPAT